MLSKAEIQSIFLKSQSEIYNDWKEFLTIKSISTDPAFKDECLQAASWVHSKLQKIGFDAKIHATSGLPLVVAERTGKVGRPTVLFYGHYDVQPVDPIELWESQPFEPQLRDKRLYARGAQDNKGQVSYFLKAVETLIEQNALNCNLKVVIEGEEESGSSGLSACLNQLKDHLKADVLMVADTNMSQDGRPAVTLGLRGLVALTVKYKGPSHDLHSGMQGGAVRNPATELARLIASFHNPDGSVAVESFYKDVIEPNLAELEEGRRNQMQDDEAQRLLGVRHLGGEVRYPSIIRIGLRPTLEINGIHGGYAGAGTKTIIPSEAFAKITARLVARQNPDEILTALEKHIRRHTPEGIQLEVSEQKAAGAALKVNIDSPWVMKATRVLEEVAGVKPAYVWEGGSIPVIAKLSEISGAEPLMVGFGLEADKIHAPNESFGLDQFKQGFTYTALFLSGL